ncbi:cleft lip and palate transmembrane protein 1 homolog [Sitophilus oryzae]|uniref:Cleft lip and palate transmembrane protein 1 homolog n=1 Tax=Sitophilus oryzae TaxID=7048 RepID=A0A6J2Y9T1_SITOR|nr:cleft lip and palate transmembrane protein 1 homolog [Sitophilus oryzae]
MSQTIKETPSGSNNEVANVAQNAADSTSTAPDGQAAAQRQPTKMESFLSLAKSLIIRALIIYFISSFFRGPKPQTANNTQGPAIQARNIFSDGTPLTLYVYLSESETLKNYSYSNLFWVKENIIYGDWTAGNNKDGIFEIEKDIPITEGMANNGSLYIHGFVTKLGYSPDPTAKNFDRDHTTSMTKQLNRFKKLKASKTKNLLTGETEQAQVEDGKIISHWHPNFTINLVTDQTLWTYGALPVPLDQFVKFTDDLQNYKPILYPNDYWNMARDYKPLNETYSLKLTFQPLSLFKWQLYAAQAMKNSMFNMFSDNEQQQTDEEQDSIKETLMDTNPYLLGITVAVSLLHSIFELLAFKNDIQFWNNRNSLEGLSVRSVFFSVFQSLVVLLYVLDNDTNLLIKVSCFVGLGIELWKIWKVVDIRFENGRLIFKDKGSYIESSTKVYDELAFKYLSWLCFPLLAGYCVYALLYLEHKGWYSFVLDLLYGYLLTFGFIMMTPQLFINYKLKSVAHLPWRMLTYKFLNTFIDDMFAFVIKMPTMYRIGCFRDDIVFLVFLYQKYIYPVDKTRRNEFGYSAEQEEQKAIANGEVNEVQPVAESKKDQ